MDTDELDETFPLTETDRHILSLTDEQYEPHGWDDLKDIIANNSLEVLKRYPSDLRRYIRWSAATKKQYGSMVNFVIQERLHWKPLELGTPHSGPIFEVQNPTPFADPSDYLILPNDWPYGLDREISHLIVWLKTRLEVDSERGDLTSKARKQVNDFVDRHFVEPVKALTGSADSVLWFKNWVSLQSVPGIDHVHVLVRGLSKDQITQHWTQGRQALQDQVQPTSQT